MKQRLSILAILLMALALPQSVRAYDFSAVAPSGQTLYYTIVDGNVSVTIPNGYTKPTGDLTIPSTVTNDGTTYSVTSIGQLAFRDCTNLTSVTIPNSVTDMSQAAFWNCSGLTTVTIGDGVTSIGISTFLQCSSLTSITIPNSVTTIGANSFCECSSLTSVTIPNSVTSIGNYAFENCTSLTSVTIPNSVTTIGGAAFYNCTSLTSVTIPNSVTTIGEGAFGGVRHIEYYGDATGAPWDAYSMNGVTEGDFVYYDGTKTNLIAYIGDGGDVTIANNVDTIGDYAFSGCSSLTSVSIPNSVTTIGLAAFRKCSGLTSVTIPNSVTEISGYAFYGCTGLTSVTIPNNVTTIGFYAFYGCTGLTSVTIPNNVTTIGYYAFKYCTGLSSVTIGNSVTSIGYEAFRYCSGLTSVTILAEVPPMCGGDVFLGIDDTCTLYAPTCSYHTTSPWNSSFQNIVTECPEHIVTLINDGDGYMYDRGTNTFIEDTVRISSYDADSVKLQFITFSPEYEYYDHFFGENTGFVNPQLNILYVDGVRLDISTSNGNLRVYDGMSTVNYIGYMLTIATDTDHVVRAVFGPWGSTPDEDTTSITPGEDTTIVTPVGDTVYVLDTVIVEVPVHDTTYITLTDTVTNTVYYCCPLKLRNASNIRPQCR